jgi:hypothetical protein
VKSALVLAAGCLIAAMAVGDTVYRIAPRSGVTYPVEVAKASVGDTSELTGQDDEQMDSDLDNLFANAKDGLDASELASVRELASIAKPHSSHWGDDFFKEGASGVGNVSDFTMKNVTGCWDPTLDRIARDCGSGSGPGIGDEYALAPVSNGRFYGGGTGSISGSSHHASHIASQYCPKPPPTAVPEPSSASLILLGAVSLLRRRKSK